LQYAFRDRKNKKRAFRSLWISRINAGARELGTSYSVLINSMSKKNINLDRKILSDIAVYDRTAFEKIVKKATS
jgi:ribosomal protein L20